MTDQPNDTSATAYVDDGETLHGVGHCGACALCGRPVPKEKIWEYSWCGCVNRHLSALDEYRRRVSNQFAKIFPSLREADGFRVRGERGEHTCGEHGDPALCPACSVARCAKVERAEEPDLIRAFRFALHSAKASFDYHREVRASGQRVDNTEKVMLESYWPESAVALAEDWLDRPYRPEPPPAAPVPSSVRDARCICQSAPLGSTFCKTCGHDLSCPWHMAHVLEAQGEGKAGEASDDELRQLDHDAQSAKAKEMYAVSPGGIDMNPVYSAGRRALFRSGFEAGRAEPAGMPAPVFLSEEDEDDYYSDQLSRTKERNESLRLMVRELLRAKKLHRTKRYEAEEERDRLRSELAGVQDARDAQWRLAIEEFFDEPPKTPAEFATCFNSNDEVVAALVEEQTSELEGAQELNRAAIRGLQDERDRLRHSVTEQQGEIARLREELGKTERLSASEEYRSLREAHADRDAYRRECNNLRCELAKAQERNAELEHFKRQHEVECPRRETIRRLEEDNARLQKELRDARSLLNRWMGWSSSVQELPPDGLYELSLAAIEKPPTASAKESEDKCAKCAGSGRMWDNGDKCACDDCNGTGKTATVESGAESLARIMADPACVICGGTGRIPTHGVYCKSWCWCECAKTNARKPTQQASATEQPTDRLAEMARRAGPLPTTFLAGSPLTNEQAPAPVGGGNSFDYLKAAAESSVYVRENYRSSLPLQVLDAIDYILAYLERLTGENAAREGKT